MNLGQQLKQNTEEYQKQLIPDAAKEYANIIDYLQTQIITHKSPEPIIYRRHDFPTKSIPNFCKIYEPLLHKWAKRNNLQLEIFVSINVSTLDWPYNISVSATPRKSFLEKLLAYCIH